jgi:hypothetical protein
MEFFDLTGSCISELSLEKDSPIPWAVQTCGDGAGCRDPAGRRAAPSIRAPGRLTVAVWAEDWESSDEAVPCHAMPSPAASLLKNGPGPDHGCTVFSSERKFKNKQLRAALRLGGAIQALRPTRASRGLSDHIWNSRERQSVSLVGLRWRNPEFSARTPKPPKGYPEIPPMNSHPENNQFRMLELAVGIEPTTF